MIIFSKNGMVLINTNHIKSIYIGSGTIFTTYNSDTARIGEYDNEDRAIEILTQIMAAIQREQRVFYMPEE